MFNPNEEAAGAEAASQQTKSNRTESVDLNNANDSTSGEFLKIEISDALNEKDKVKFTVKTKVYLNFNKRCTNEFILNR